MLYLDSFAFYKHKNVFQIYKNFLTVNFFKKFILPNLLVIKPRHLSSFGGAANWLILTFLDIRGDLKEAAYLEYYFIFLVKSN